MGRTLQRKKLRSSRPKVRQNPKSKLPNIRSNSIVAANWNAKQTLRQNYQRLGLTSRLNPSTGGVEKTKRSETAPSTNTTAGDPLAIPTNTNKVLKLGEIRVERDPKTGAITKVIQDESGGKPRRENPLNDLLNEISDEDDEDYHNVDDGDGGRGTERRRNDTAAVEGIIPDLEKVAKSGKTAAPRKQSQREREWIEALVAKWGDDYAAMFRDRKLNTMQQSEGDIRRRVKIWRRESGE